MSLGMMTMIRMLSDNEDSNKALSDSLGKKIVAIDLADDGLLLALDDGSRLRLADRAQSCCEHRYMRTDDDVPYFVGATLVGAEVNDAPNVVTEEDSYGDHEVQFLVVHTSNGDLTISSHNEHNGYYGGICIEASVEQVK